MGRLVLHAVCPSTSQHGTRTAYMTYGCRCPEARAAEAAYRRSYDRRRYLNGSRPLSVPMMGTRRRIEALQWMGWPLREIDARLGRSGKCRTILYTGQAEVLLSTATAIAVIYDQLCMQPGPSKETRRRAIKKGFASPLAWDDETIDDPFAMPDTGEASTGALLEDMEFLLDHGVSREQIAERLGVKVNTLIHTAYTAGRKDLTLKLTRQKLAVAA